MQGRCVLAVLTVVAAGMVGFPVAADEPAEKVIAQTPGTSYTRSAPTGWQSQTRHEDPHEKMPRPVSELTIRAYEGFTRLQSYYGDEPAYGVDVTAEIEKCPDGNDRIRALNIGGWLYAVDGDCSDNHRGKRAGVSREGPENDTPPPGEAVMRCDPATWRCRTIDR